MKYTIKDIAKRANVSITTVSLVMNNKPHRISVETVKKIQDVIEELNYKPSLVAQSMITNKTRTIGLIVPDITNPFFSQVAKSIEENLRRYSYNMFLCNSYNMFEREKEYIEVLKDRQVDGIIISSINTITKEQYEQLNSLKITFIFLDRSLGIDSKNVISVKDEVGGYIATKYLIEKGHTQIACINSNRNIKNIDKRVEGYKRALEEYNIKLDDKSIISVDLTIDGGIMAGEQLFSEMGATAVFCCNDLIAIGLYEAAKKYAINIPRDISVVGFDDIAFSRYLNPALTTIRQPIEDISSFAVNCLMDILENNKKYFKSISVNVDLVERDSVLDIRANEKFKS